MYNDTNVVFLPNIIQIKTICCKRCCLSIFYFEGRNAIFVHYQSPLYLYLQQEILSPEKLQEEDIMKTIKMNNIVLICSSYSTLSSNELREFYILLPPAHLDTPTPTQLLNGAYNPDKCYKAPQVINLQQLSLCIARFSFYHWVNWGTFRVQILPRNSRHRRLLSVWRDSNPRSCNWESSALTTWPTVLP